MKIRRENSSVSLENKWFDLHCVHIWLFCVTNPLMLSCCKNLAWTQYTNDSYTLTDWGCCSKSFWGRYGRRSQVTLGFGSRILHLIKSRLFTEAECHQNPSKYDANCWNVMSNQSMFDPTVITKNQSKQTKKHLSFLFNVKMPRHWVTQLANKYHQLQLSANSGQKKKLSHYSYFDHLSTPKLGLDRKPMQTEEVRTLKLKIWST